MSLAIYLKQTPETVYRQKINQKKKDRFFAVSISLIGVFSIIFATWPLLVWNIKIIPQLSVKVDNAPIPQKEVLSAKSTLLKDVQVAKDSDGFSYFTTSTEPAVNRPQEFYLTIPKLKIENAVVKVDTLKFYDNLGLFPGTALPGEVGNAFVTGHSALPQFYNPKNYREIFTNLSELEIGDIVYARISGKTYQYLVQYKKVVDPNDISVLAPIARDAKNMTLMTCVPPGTSIKRLIVVTSLIV